MATSQELLAKLNARGVTNSMIADMLGVSSRYVNYVRNGKKPGNNLQAQLEELLSHVSENGHSDSISRQQTVATATLKRAPKTARREREREQDDEEPEHTEKKTRRRKQQNEKPVEREDEDNDELEDEEPREPDLIDTIISNGIGLMILAVPVFMVVVVVLAVVHDLRETIQQKKQAQQSQQPQAQSQPSPQAQQP